MRVQCQNCKSIYELDEARFANVSEVKCSQCGAVIVLKQEHDHDSGGDKGKTMFMPAMSTAAKQIGGEGSSPGGAGAAGAGGGGDADSGGDKGKTMFMPAMSTAAKQMQEQAVSQGEAQTSASHGQQGGGTTPEQALASASVSTDSQALQQPKDIPAPALEDRPPMAKPTVKSAARSGIPGKPPISRDSKLPLILGIAVPAGLVLVVILLWLFVFSK